MAKKRNLIAAYPYPKSLTNLHYHILNKCRVRVMDMYHIKNKKIPEAFTFERSLYSYLLGFKF